MMSLWRPADLAWKQLAGRVWHEIEDDDVFGQAAKLSYYFLLAFFPLLLFLTTLFGYFAQSEDLRATLLEYFRNLVPPSAFQLVVNTLDQISSGAGGGKLSIGILGTLWAASNGMAALSQGLNAAYEINEGRPWWQSRLIAAVLTLALAIFTAAALILVLAGEKIGAFLAGHFGLEDAFAKAWNIGRWPVALVLVLIVVDLLYRFAPDPKNRKRNWITPGGLVAVALWFLVSLGFRFYLRFFNYYKLTYGSLGAVIVLMLWFYLTSAAILIGAEVNFEMENAAARTGDRVARLTGRKRSGGNGSKLNGGEGAVKLQLKNGAMNSDRFEVQLSLQPPRLAPGGGLNVFGRWRIAIVCFLALLGSVASAQVSDFEGRRIVDIQFSPASPLDPADQERVQPLRKGEPLRGQDVADAIDGLFATGCFEDIVVEAEPSGDGVIIRFVTQNTWFVGGVALEGKVTPPPNRPQVAGAGQITLGAPFHDEDLKQALDGMKRLLDANGLYKAEVTSAVERGSAAQQVFLTFRIRGHKRAKYEKPLIQGETKLPENTILHATGWRLPILHWWRQVTEARTHDGVQGVLQKYAKEDRLAARVTLEKLDYDAGRRLVRPTLNINAGPKVEVKALEAKVSKRVLKRYVPVFQEGTIDNDLLMEGRRNLHDYFQSKGYYEVDVDFRVQPLHNDTQVVEYVITQGPREKLAHLVIAGNKYFRTDDIRERMLIQPGSFPLGRGRYSEAFRLKDEENISNLYRSNGFRDVKVSFVVDRNYQGKAGDIAVTVKIEEGPQWMVDNLTLDGITVGDRDELVSKLASVPGQPFAGANLSTDRNQALAYYYSRGFPDANFKATWEASGTPHHVNLAYTITEGERQYVREVRTSGLRTTRQSVVGKRITLRPGDPLSPMEQIDTQKRLYDLGIFARIDTAIQNPDGDTRHKYVLYNFEEASRYNVGIGVGAQIARFGSPSKTSVSAPAGSTGFSPSVSLNVSRINFLGIGHTVTLQGSYSSLEKGGSLSYLDPRFRSREGRSLTVTLTYDNSLNVSTFASKRQEASVQLSQRFTKSTSGLFRFAYRRVSVGSVVIPVLLVPLLLQPVRIGMLSGNFLRDRRDDAAEPHSGTYNSADIGVSGRFFGSQRSFGRILLRNATYHRLTKNTVLARQTQFGVIAAFSAPSGISARESVPLPERFFGGGADSLRAFPFNQAGPRDTGAALVAGGEASQPTGFPLGGNALLFNNVELRFPLIGQNIQGVLFHDVGNVFSTLSNMSFRFRQRDLQDFDYAAHAVGLGVRYRTPVGPIRVDLAYSLNPPSFLGFKGLPAELLQCNPNQTTLPGFCQAAKQSVSHFQFFISIGQTF